MKIVVLCLDAVGPRMAGIAIRSVEIARQLSHHADVTLVAARSSGDIDLDIPVVAYDRHDGRSVRPHLAGADAVVCQPQWPLVMRELRASGARLVFDLSCPEIIETLTFRAGDEPTRRRLITAMTADRLVEALRIGHHFVTSTSRQLDLWLGVAAGERLLTPDAYDRDPTLRSRFALAPHGVPERPPRRSGAPGLHGTLGLDPATPVVLWTSAIWSWLDAETPIRAMPALRDRLPHAQLVFLGADPERVAGASAHARAKALAAELGLLGAGVLFHEQWLTYAERSDWLLDAGCAVSCHRRHLETRFAFRTRYLDCLWAGLPLVVTEGDVLADRIAAENLGATVPEGDPAALAAALDHVLEQSRTLYAQRLAVAAADYVWPRALAELVAFATSTGPRPVPLGEDAPRRPGHAARDRGYRAVKRALNAAGVRDWPRGLAG
jgi:glycosyltransferase involved in cell wall biosynthesis